VNIIRGTSSLLAVTSPGISEGIQTAGFESARERERNGEDKYISFALRNKRINHKSIIHRSGNSNQSRGVADDEYVTRNCAHRYSAGNVPTEDTFTY